MSAKVRPPQTSNVRAGYCSRCQQWLGYSGEDQWSSAGLRGRSQLQEQRWIVENIGELVTRAPGLSNSPSPQSINEPLGELISRLVKGTAPAVADLIGVRNKIISFWQGGRSIPKLEFILKFCYRLDLSVADFLTAMIGRLGCGTQIDATQLQSPEVPTTREAVAAWEANVRRTLEAALVEDPPPPLSEVAGRVGYASTGPLYGKYGEPSRRIAARYRMTVGGHGSIRLSPDKKQPSLLRQLLEQELSKENPCHPRNLAKEAGYRHVDTAERQCPELWLALLDKRRKYGEEEKAKQNERIREAITSALSEDPTPPLKEIFRRLGYRSRSSLSQRFPDECRAVKEKRDRGRKERLEELEAKLRAALSEEPPRPLTHVAAGIHYNRHDCYRRWPELCRAVAARHIEYINERARKKRLALKEQVRQIMLELHRYGLHPTKERVNSRLHNPLMIGFHTFNEPFRQVKEELNLPSL